MPRPINPPLLSHKNSTLLPKWIHLFLQQTTASSPPPPTQTPLQITTPEEPPSIKSLEGLHHLKQVLPHMITTNTPLTPLLFQKLIDLSLSSSHSHSLSLLFTQFQHHINTDLCNFLIKSYTNSNHHLHAVLVYIHMTKLSFSPDLFAFPPLLKSLAQLNLPCLGIPSHACIVKLGFSSDVYSNTALVNLYCTFSRIDEARQLFDEMPNRNTVSWNAMITGYVHNRRFREAHELFSEMLASDVVLGEVTVVCALSACAHLGALNQGLWIHSYIRNHSLRLNVFVGSALIDMYMKCGVVDEALKVFRVMSMKNVFTWNSLISGFAMNGRGEAAMEAFDAMVKENIKPDGVTFLALLCACCHQGSVDQGRKLFADMGREFGVQPKIEHYGCMVDLLSRAGFLEEAYELVKTMPIEADAVVWRSLLAGCRIHGNTKLGELAIEKLVELEPGNGENYVLLSNVLARDQRWSEVGKVREVMSQRRIQKVPGSSSTEIDNMVYEFVVTSQFEKDGLNEIYTMLENMKRELRSAGYAADTEMVSYDLEEEEKENSLMHHSEKLALAFGLLKTQHGSSIRIVKNLRVCKDCHSFFKFVSKVYQREIVLRDRNRFHHFSRGVCSCRDYW